MSYKIVYNEEGNILASVPPDANVEAVKTNWPGSNHITVDKELDFKYWNYFCVNTNTQQLERI